MQRAVSIGWNYECQHSHQLSFINVNTLHAWPRQYVIFDFNGFSITGLMNCTSGTRTGILTVSEERLAELSGGYFLIYKGHMYITVERS